MIHVAAKAVLGPLLLVQAGRLRRSVIELPEAAGERRGIAGCGPARLSLLIVGDSSAAGVGAREQGDALTGHLTRALAERLGVAVRWQLVAQTGARSEDVARLLLDAELDPADVGIAVVGVNDITKEVPLDRALAQRSAIAAAMRRRAGVRHVIFPALPDMEKFPALPQPLAWYAGRHARHNNAAQAAWAVRQAGVSHAAMDGVMDPALMADDGFHPGPALYARVASRLADHIENDVLPGLDNNKKETV